MRKIRYHLESLRNDLEELEAKVPADIDDTQAISCAIMHIEAIEGWLR